MKRTLLIFATALLSSIAVFAQEPPVDGFCGTTDNGADGTNLTWAYDNLSQTLTISGSGAMADYDWNLQPWKMHKKVVRSVVVEEGVTSVGNYAFCDLINATSVSLSESVTSIGKVAFHGCSTLTALFVPAEVTCIGERAFGNCVKLNTISIPDGVSFLDNGTFRNCYVLRDIWCYAPVPPAACFGTFAEVPREEVTVHVLKGSLSLYQNADEWKLFSKYTAIEGYQALFLKSGNAEWGTVSGQGAYKTGVTATVSASPAADCAFVGWSDGSKENPRQVVMNNDVDLTALFTPCSLKIHVASAGTLSALLKDEGANAGMLRSLTLTGTLNDDDFNFIRTELKSLRSLNLYQLKNKALPDKWLEGNTTIRSLVLQYDLRTIGNSAFAGCSAIDTLHLPLWVSEIGEKAFARCTGIRSMKVDSKTPPVIYANTFEGVSRDIEFIIPESSREQYLSHEFWKEFLLKASSDIENSRISVAKVYTSDGTLHVDGADQLTSDYHVLDASGRLIYSGRQGSINLPQGVYMVTIDGEIQKIAL